MNSQPFNPADGGAVDTAMRASARTSLAKLDRRTAGETELHPPFNVNAVDAANCEVRSPYCERRPVRQSKFDLRSSPRLWIQLFHSALNPKGRAGFPLAKGTRNAHTCAMTIIEDGRKCAAEQGIAEEEASQQGMEAESKEFAERGAEVYAKA